jgi:hypothetical protein
VTDEQGILRPDQEYILRIFTEHMTRRFDHIPVDEERIRKIVSCGLEKLSASANIALEEPITVDELELAIKTGNKNKSPGHDGISHEFFKAVWGISKHEMLEVMNNMCIDGALTETEKNGIIVCLPKKMDPTGPEDYRPLTLLNNDYKLLTRILANRLRPWLHEYYIRINIVEGKEIRSSRLLRRCVT